MIIKRFSFILHIDRKVFTFTFHHKTKYDEKISHVFVCWAY
ncbi:hypothetical protein P278_02760 [Zhouia amylolytica AD3]|uniref:Uncharacterized protein n=1 Tax=Zhouia amylolytica AD3 TaxID=1286632 RepID=W2URS1_9FLAO|nr:hypothetical protein P278_02760 [Zhouia amylolytica AD3]